MKYDPAHDFTPLRHFCRRHDHMDSLPWEYMGSDDRGNAYYRERENENRVLLNENGRLACMHVAEETSTGEARLVALRSTIR